MYVFLIFFLGEICAADSWSSKFIVPKFEFLTVQTQTPSQSFQSKTRSAIINY